MAAYYALAWLEDELFPAARARLSIELDLCSLVRIEGDVLNLLVGRVMADADARDLLIIGHLQAALELIALLHFAVNIA